MREKYVGVREKIRDAAAARAFQRWLPDGPPMTLAIR
jgi:hypothetical protein